MKNSISLFFLLMVVQFWGCKKPTKSTIAETVSYENILNINTHIVDTSAISNATAMSLTLNTNKLTFNPSIGDILLAAPSANDSFGLLVKITGITQNGNEINCTTQISNLNAAFKQLYINYTYQAPYSSNGQLRTTNEGSSLDLSLSPNFLPTGGGGLELSGNFQINIPQTIIKYVKDSSSILPDTIIISASLNTNGSSLEIEANGFLQVSEMKLYTFNLPIIEIPVPVGAVIIPIPFQQEVDLYILPAKISSKMKVTILPQISTSLGLSYENGNWSNLSSFTIGASAYPLLGTDFAPNMTADLVFFDPKYIISPCIDPNLSAFFEIANELEFNIQTATPNYSLNYKLVTNKSNLSQKWQDLSRINIV